MSKLPNKQAETGAEVKAKLKALRQRDPEKFGRLMELEAKRRKLLVPAKG